MKLPGIIGTLAIILTGCDINQDNELTYTLSSGINTLTVIDHVNKTKCVYRKEGKVYTKRCIKYRKKL